MVLHNFLASSGYTKDLDKRFEIWVHGPYDEDACHPIKLTLTTLAKYAGCEVLYFSPDYERETGRLWITVGIKDVC